MPETTLAPDIAEEAFHPDLSTDTFTLCGKTVRIKPLTVLHQVQFVKLLNNVLKESAYQIDEQQWASVAAEVTAHPEILPKLVHLICLNDDAGLTEDQILNQAEVGLMDMGELVLKLCLKNEKIGKPVLDFFSKAWPLMKQAMAIRSELGLVTLQQEITDTTTTLSKLSASVTTNSRTKSARR